MDYILSFSLILFEILCLVNLCSAFFESKKTYKQKLIIWFVYGVVFSIATQFALRESSFLKTIVIIWATVLIVNITYEGKFISKIFMVLIWHIIAMAADYVFIFAIMMILNVTMQQLVSSVVSFILCALSSRFVFYIITFIYKKYKKGEKTLVQITYKEWVQILTFPIVSIITIVVIIDSGMRNNDASILILLNAIGLILANVVVLMLISQLEDEKRIKQNNLMLNQQMDLEMKKAKALMDAYDSQRKMTHDFENHLTAIKGLAYANKNKDLEVYAGNLLNEIQLNALVVSTNNPIIDAILNLKYNTCKKLNIAMEFKVNDLSSVKIGPEDLVTVLANALDNAIEACSGLENEKIIKVNILNEQDELVISISNSVEKAILIKDNAIVTSKKNELAHGYGLRNIKAVLSKYENIFAIKCEDGWFQLTAVIM